MDVARQQRLAELQKRFSEFKQYEKLTAEAVDSKWREILSHEKLQQQKKSIDSIKVDYARQLDRYDSIIHRLMQWVNDGESQYQFALRAHKKNLELLCNLAIKRFDTEKQRFDKNLNTIVDDFESTKAKSQEEFQAHIAEVTDIKNAIEHEYKQTKDDLERVFKAEKDALTMKSQEAISALRTHITDETNRVLMDQTNANENFKHRSEAKLAQFQQLFEKHRRNQKQMKKNEALIIKNQAEIAHWRRKIKNNEKESRESNDRLRQEKDNLGLHFRELKDVIAKFRNVEARKLAQVSIAFEDAINAVAEKLTLAEKVLKYSEMTRKLETEREQVTPFPPSIVETDPEIQRQMAQFKLQLKGDSKFVGESDMFDKFYRRFNKVLLDKMSLLKEKEALTAHNQRLKTMMKHYMEGMAVNGAVMNKPNTLFILNQRTNAPLRRVDQENIPVIDAQQTIHDNKLQGY